MEERKAHDSSSASIGAAARHGAHEIHAVILAGGKGTNLFPFTESVPKCALPVVNRPLITYQLDLLQHCGIHGASPALPRRQAQR